MFIFSKKSVLFILLSLIGMCGVVNSMYGSALLPVSSEAYELYPYNTVGKVFTEDGLVATGTIVSDKIVVTSASVFREYLETSSNPELYFSKDGTEVVLSVSSWDVYSGFTSEYENEGPLATSTLSRDLMVLVFEERVFESHALLTQRNLREDDYRKIVGYASGRYLEGDSLADSLHATNRGESVYTQFGKVDGRLYHSGDIKGTLGSEGAPVFSYYDERWSVDGFVVGYDLELGGVLVVEIDSSINQFVQGAIAANDSTVNLPDSDFVSVDLNGRFRGASELLLNHGTNFTISPTDDIDYHQVTVVDAGTYTLRSYGDLDLSGALRNEENQLIIEGYDSAGSLNFNMDMYLEPGNYYLQTRPYSSDDKGVYGLSFVREDGVDVEFLDDGFTSNVLMNLLLGQEGLNYRIKESGEVDSFRVVLNQEGRLILNTSGDLDLIGKIVPENAAPAVGELEEEVFAQSDDALGYGSNIVLDALLPAGVYIVVIEARNAGEFGPYQMSSSFSAEAIVPEL